MKIGQKGPKRSILDGQLKVAVCGLSVNLNYLKIDVINFIEIRILAGKMS